MIIYRIREQKGFSPHLAGATLGEKQLDPLLRELGAAPQPTAAGRATGQIVVFDMNEVETVTASYLKATILRLLRRAGATSEGSFGQGMGGQEQGGEPWLDIFPVVAGLSSDVREELDEVLTPRKLCCLEAVEIAAGRVVKARLCGLRDGVTATTLAALTSKGQATAAQLHERYDDKINITAWNNRLFDLYRLRLARRSKQDRQWVYEPVAEEVTAEVLHG